MCLGIVYVLSNTQEYLTENFLRIVRTWVGTSLDMVGWVMYKMSKIKNTLKLKVYEFSNIPLEHIPNPEPALDEGIPFIWWFGDAWGMLQGYVGVLLEKGNS